MNQQTIQIPTPEAVAKEVVLQLEKMGLVVPAASLTIDQAAEFLQVKPQQVRALVELKRLKARDISVGTGEKAKLRFSPVVLAEYLKGD